MLPADLPGIQMTERMTGNVRNNEKQREAA